MKIVCKMHHNPEEVIHPDGITWIKEMQIWPNGIILNLMCGHRVHMISQPSCGDDHVTVFVTDPECNTVLPRNRALEGV